MNRKEYQQLSDDRELQNRFTAYVQKAMENTRSTYYRKKMAIQERETVYDEVDDLEIADSSDMLDTLFVFNVEMLENISLWKALHKLHFLSQTCGFPLESH